MLVLSRKRSQTIVIQMADGTQVSVIVVALRGDKVKLGVEAPADVRIDRAEVAVKRQAEGGAA